MKLFRILPIVALVLLAACQKQLTPEELSPDAAYYVGTVSVISKGETFDNNNKRICFSPSEDGTAATIIFYRIKFVPAMPVTINVTIPNVSMTRVDGKIYFEADDIIPLTMGGEYPKYTVHGLEGVADDEHLEFSLKFGEYPTWFSGSRTLD